MISLASRASDILGMSSTTLEQLLASTRPNPYLPEVLAYVIWATFAYACGLVDHHNVDALRGEYPWIPEFED